MLCCATASEAALTLAGSGMTCRVARSLAASLILATEWSVVELRPFGLAVIGAGLINADELATVLDARSRTAGPVASPATADVRVAQRRRELLPVAGRRSLVARIARIARIATIFGLEGMVPNGTELGDRRRGIPHGICIGCGRCGWDPLRERCCGCVGSGDVE